MNAYKQYLNLHCDIKTYIIAEDYFKKCGELIEMDLIKDLIPIINCEKEFLRIYCWRYKEKYDKEFIVEMEDSNEHQ